MIYDVIICDVTRYDVMIYDVIICDVTRNDV